MDRKIGMRFSNLEKYNKLPKSSLSFFLAMEMQWKEEGGTNVKEETSENSVGSKKEMVDAKVLVEHHSKSENIVHRL